jgi:hypothetical protein
MESLKEILYGFFHSLMNTYTPQVLVWMHILLPSTIKLIPSRPEFFLSTCHENNRRNQETNYSLLESEA